MVSSLYSSREEVYNPCVRSYRPGVGFKRYSCALQQLLPVRKLRVESNVMPVDSVGMLSLASFSWLSSLMWKAYRHGLNASDLPRSSPLDSCEYNCRRLEFLWIDEVKRRGERFVSLSWAVWRFVGTRLLVALAVLCLSVVFSLLGPMLCMRSLLACIENGDSVSIWSGLYWSAALVMCEVCRVLLFAGYWSVSYRTGCRLRAGCVSAVYRHVLQLPSTVHLSAGQLVNVLSNDVQRLFDVCLYAPLVVTGPLVGVVGLFYIGSVLSGHALLGMLTFLLFYPLQFGLSRLGGRLRRATLSVTDERVQRVTEMLRSMRLIKLYGWRPFFQQKLEEDRRREQRLLMKSGWVQSVGVALAPVSPIIASIVAFLAHIAAGHSLTATQAFPVVAFCFGRLRPVVTMHLLGVSSIWQCRPSIQRIQRVLMMCRKLDSIKLPDDVSHAVVIRGATLSWPLYPPSSDSCEKVQKKAGTQFYVGGTVNQHYREVLHDISLVVNKGSLIGVCGAVGSGKSSLIAAILGDLYLNNGQVALDGSCALVSQHAWILPTTIKRNICFSHRFDERRYREVLSACCLEPDLASMPLGDLTVLGDSGVNVSGGQKQRIALARALYADREIYILDDPFACLDSNVAEHIFSQCVLHWLAVKTVILVTNQSQYLSRCDAVYVLSEGRIVQSGPHHVLISGDGEYSRLIHSSPAENPTPSMTSPPPSPSDCHSSSSKPQDNSPVSRLIVESSVPSGNKCSSSDSCQKVTDSQSSNAGIGREKRQRSIPGSVYGQYVSAAGGWIPVLVVVAVFTLNVFCSAFSSWWLANWINQGDGRSINSPSNILPDNELNYTLLNLVDRNSTVSSHAIGSNPANFKTSSTDTLPGNISTAANVSSLLRRSVGEGVDFTPIDPALSSTNSTPSLLDSAASSVDSAPSSVDSAPSVGDRGNLSDNPHLSFYQTVYACLILFVLATSLLRSLVFVQVTLRAASQLHSRLTSALFAATMYFFDRTPSGSIVNHFAKDMDEIDSRLLFLVETLLQNALLVIISVLFACIVFPLLLPAVCLFAAAFFAVRMVFRAGMCDLKRLESASKAPLFGHVMSTIEGLSTIHAFRKEREFCSKFMSQFDESSAAFYLFHCSMRWVAVRLDCLTVCVTALTCVLVVLSAGVVSAAWSGLALAQIYQLSGIFQYTVRVCSEAEARFTSVQRITDFTERLEAAIEEERGISAPVSARSPQTVDDTSLFHTRHGVLPTPNLECATTPGVPDTSGATYPPDSSVSNGPIASSVASAHPTSPVRNDPSIYTNSLPAPVVMSSSITSSAVISRPLVSKLVGGPARPPPPSVVTSPVTEDWPLFSRVTFDNVSLWYPCRNSESALRDVSFTTQPHEFIGVVGRTGAGKSSLATALVRLYPPQSGRVLIDGVDLVHVSLTTLRSRVCVVPQEPLLLSGSIRYNLCPDDSCSDERLWRALQAVSLRSSILQMPEGLATHVQSGGVNLSAGQRQLLCLARALLTNCRVLFIDEATSCVDGECDSSVQHTLRTVFVHCTVFIVAHRPSTLSQCSRIIVMENGRLVEFESLHRLLSRPDFAHSALLTTDTGHL